MLSGRTISRNSPLNTCSSPSGPRCTIRHAPPGRKSTSQLATSCFLGPHQFDRCSHEVWASNTRSRGASKTRVMTISRSDGVVTVSALPPLPPPHVPTLAEGDTAQSYGRAVLGKLVIANALMTAAFCLLPAPSAPAWSNGVDAYGLPRLDPRPGPERARRPRRLGLRRAVLLATDSPDTVDGIDHASETWWHVWDQRCRW